MKKILVCGGRTYDNAEHVAETLKAFDPSLVISGGAPGADALAEAWAKANGVPCQIFKADWRAHGRAAGPIRNRQMLEEGRPDYVVAFPGGRGTADMIRQARKAGVCVVERYAPSAGRAALEQE